MFYWKNPGAQLIATVAGWTIVAAGTIYLAGGFSNALSVDFGIVPLVGTIVLGAALAGVHVGVGALRNRRGEE